MSLLLQSHPFLLEGTTSGGGKVESLAHLPLTCTFDGLLKAGTVSWSGGSLQKAISASQEGYDFKDEGLGDTSQKTTLTIQSSELQKASSPSLTYTCTIALGAETISQEIEVTISKPGDLL